MAESCPCFALACGKLRNSQRQSLLDPKRKFQVFEAKAKAASVRASLRKTLCRQTHDAGDKTESLHKDGTSSARDVNSEVQARSSHVKSTVPSQDSPYVCQSTFEHGNLVSCFMAFKALTGDRLLIMLSRVREICKIVPMRSLQAKFGTASFS